MKSKHIFIVLAFTFLCVANVFGQRDRAFVSLSGSDTPSCGAQATPCKTFGGGLSSIASGGSVIALDSGIYDTINVTISKSATLMAAPGVHVEFFNDYINPDRITVNAGSSSRVTLRNLYISNLSGQYGGQGNGIRVTSVGVLQIENCVIDGFQTGLNVNLTASAQMSIKDTVIRNNSLFGASFYSTTGLVTVSVDRSHFETTGVGGGSHYAGSGVVVGKRSRVTICDSTATGNGGPGFLVYDEKAELNLERCKSSNNLDGVRAWDYYGQVPPGVATVSNSIITNNSLYGFFQDGTGIFRSLGNNVVRQNQYNSYGTITLLSGT